LRSLTRLSRSLEGIQSFDSRFAEVTSITCDNCEVVFESSGGNHTVEQGNRLSFTFQLHHQSSPSLAYIGIPGQAINRFNHVFEPLLQCLALATTRQRKNPHPQLAKNY